jgi:hypothetical protein
VPVFSSCINPFLVGTRACPVDFGHQAEGSRDERMTPWARHANWEGCGSRQWDPIAIGRRWSIWLARTYDLCPSRYEEGLFEGQVPCPGPRPGMPDDIGIFCAHSMG